MLTQIVWDVDPVFVRIGPLSLRYYGICFGTALLTGFAIWNHRVRRFGESQQFSEQFLWWAAAGVLIGGRLGHCFFYRPRFYLEHPQRIVAIWDGGISSHGVAIGLALALWMISRRHHVRYLLLADYLAPAVALAVGWIRVGNFFNSELFGSPSTMPWAVIFARVDTIPRHPVQLYDMLMGPITWLVLRTVERRSIRPIGSGLIAGVFLTTYFSLRFCVEFFKAFFEEQLRTMPPFRTLEEVTGLRIHTGQWLSVLPVLVGLVLVVRALRTTPPMMNGAALKSGPDALQPAHPL